MEISNTSKMANKVLFSYQELQQVFELLQLSWTTYSHNWIMKTLIHLGEKSPTNASYHVVTVCLHSHSLNRDL